MNYHYEFHNVFSLTSNIDYFEGLLHAFRNTGGMNTNTTFEFVLDNRLRTSLRQKPVFNLMLGYDAQTNSVEFSYPWIRPICARLTSRQNGFTFSFNKNYLRFSNFVGGGWELDGIFRSILMVFLIRSGLYMVHGASVKLDEEGILIPSFANTGKTTTSWTLARQGAKYLTDELSVIDPRRNCFSFPCSSLVTARLAQSLDLDVTKKQKLSLRLNDLKSKLLSARFAPGGVRLYPDHFFEVCDLARIAKIAFIQNGIDDRQKVPLDEAITRMMAIRDFELRWDANPYIIAESFFNPKFELETIRRRERAFVATFLSGFSDIHLISSTTGSHYKMLQSKSEEALKPLAPLIQP